MHGSISTMRFHPESSIKQEDKLSSAIIVLHKIIRQIMYRDNIGSPYTASSDNNWIPTEEHPISFSGANAEQYIQSASPSIRELFLFVILNTQTAESIEAQKAWNGGRQNRYLRKLISLHANSFLHLDPNSVIKLQLVLM